MICAAGVSSVQQKNDPAEGSTRRASLTTAISGQATRRGNQAGHVDPTHDERAIYAALIQDPNMCCRRSTSCTQDTCYTHHRRRSNARCTPTRRGTRFLTRARSGSFRSFLASGCASVVIATSAKMNEARTTSAALIDFMVKISVSSLGPSVCLCVDMSFSMINGRGQRSSSD